MVFTAVEIGISREVQGDKPDRVETVPQSGLTSQEGVNFRFECCRVGVIADKDKIGSPVRQCPQKREECRLSPEPEIVEHLVLFDRCQRDDDLAERGCSKNLVEILKRQDGFRAEPGMRVGVNEAHGHLCAMEIIPHCFEGSYM